MGETRIGECKQCGRCCKFDHLWDNMSFWEKFIYYLIMVAKTKKLRVIDKVRGSVCPYLDKGEVYYCKNYDNRPDFCRKFPAEINDNRGINCGYSFKEN